MIAAARRLAGDNTKFVLANIIHSVPAVAELSVPVEFFERAREESQAELAEMAKEAGLDATVVVKTGHPAQDILTIADEHKVNLIIIGSHRPGLQDYLLGSTAARVVRHAQCPVLVMR